MSGRRATQGGPTGDERVLVHYTGPDGTPSHVTPDAAALVAFEAGRPHRIIPSFFHQKHTSGLYWSATDRQLLHYESYLEAQWMTLADFDPTVTAIAPQPFTIQALDPSGSWSHTPDLFLRLHDGRGRVLDVKNPRKVGDEKVVLQARRTHTVCADMGFDYQLVAEPDPMTWRNVRWLAGYRRPLTLPDGLTAALLDEARTPIPLGELADAFDFPELARTAVLRACWFHQLTFDITRPLRDSTLLQTTAYHALEAP